MKWLIVIVFSLFSFSCSSGSVSPDEKIEFDRVIAAIKNNNGKNLGDDDYEAILDFISTGKGNWVSLYPQLRREPFTGVTYFLEGLDIAMAYALPEQPLEVLKFVNESNIDHICGVPFIEPTPQEMHFYYLKASAALRKLSKKGVWGIRCLATLNRVMSGASSAVR